MKIGAIGTMSLMSIQEAGPSEEAGSGSHNVSLEIDHKLRVSQDGLV